MNLAKLIEQASRRYCESLTPDQVRDVRGRLTFAEIDPENIRTAEVSIVLDTILDVVGATPTPTMERTAALATRCPRCNSSVSPVRLATGTAAAFCPTCRIALPDETA